MILGIQPPGPWQYYVKRKDNIGLPLMEVKRKYLTEQLQFDNFQSQQLSMLNGVAGGDQPSTPINNTISYPNKVRFVDGTGTGLGVLTLIDIEPTSFVVFKGTSADATDSFGTNSTFSYDSTVAPVTASPSSTTGNAYYLSKPPDGAGFYALHWDIVEQAWTIRNPIYPLLFEISYSYQYDTDNTGVVLSTTTPSQLGIGPSTVGNILGPYTGAVNYGTLIEA